MADGVSQQPLSRRRLSGHDSRKARSQGTGARQRIEDVLHSIVRVALAALAAFLTLPAWYVLVVWIPPVGLGYEPGRFYGLYFTNSDFIIAISVSLGVSLCATIPFIGHGYGSRFVVASLVLPFITGPIFLWVILLLRLNWKELPASPFELFVAVPIGGLVLIVISGYYSWPLSFLTVAVTKYAWERGRKTQSE
jgi:hypothetical protein